MQISNFKLVFSKESNKQEKKMFKASAAQGFLERKDLQKLKIPKFWYYSNAITDHKWQI